MRRIEKTVFVSYRRKDQVLATLVYKDLHSHGFDVFIDYDGIGPGDFEQVIVENIVARAHFLLLLTEDALTRCDDPNDWMRREIEVAIGARRNIVALLDPKFDFGSELATTRLVGALEPLRRYNGLQLPIQNFDAQMERLRTKYLSIPLDAVLHPPSPKAAAAARAQQATAAAAASVTQVPARSPLPVGHVAIIVIAHSPLASSLVAVAARILAEPSQALVALDVSDEDNIEDVVRRGVSLVEPLESSSHLIVADVFGATSSNCARTLAERLRDSRVVAGANVPMLWRAMLYATLPIDELTARAVAGGVQGVTHMTLPHGRQ